MRQAIAYYEKLKEDGMIPQSSGFEIWLRDTALRYLIENPYHE